MRALLAAALLATSVVEPTLEEVVRSSDVVAVVRITARADAGEAAIYDAEVVESFKGAAKPLRFIEGTDRKLEPSPREYLLIAWECPADRTASCNRFPEWAPYSTSWNSQTLIPLERGHSANPERLWLVTTRKSPLTPWLPSRSEASTAGMRTFVDWQLAKEEIQIYSKLEP